jgi:hypothetical protein
MPEDLPDTAISTKRHRYPSSDADTNTQGISRAAIGKASVSKLRFSDENHTLETEGKTQCCK